MLFSPPCLLNIICMRPEFISLTPNWEWMTWSLRLSIGCVYLISRLCVCWCTPQTFDVDGVWFEVLVIFFSFGFINISIIVIGIFYNIVIIIQQLGLYSQCHLQWFGPDLLWTNHCFKVKGLSVNSNISNKIRRNENTNGYRMRSTQMFYATYGILRNLFYAVKCRIEYVWCPISVGLGANDFGALRNLF